MKKLFKKLFLAFTCLCLCCCAAQAAETTIQVTDPHYDVYAAGTKVVFPTEAGDTFLSPITYAYSTYIPVRNAGEWMGKTVSWDQATQTVSLTGTGTPIFHSEEEKRAGTTSVEVNGEAQLCPDISVVVDGVKQTFKNEKGAVVHPIRAENVVYLPLRNIGELTGYEVAFTPLTEQEDAWTHGYIFLQKHISDAELTTLKTYANTLAPKISELDKLCTEFSSRVMETDPIKEIMVMKNMDSALELLPKLKAKAEETLAITKTAPQNELIQYYHTKIVTGLEQMIKANAQVVTAAQNGTQLGGTDDVAAGGSVELMQAIGGNIYFDCFEMMKVIEHKIVVF